MRPFFLSFLLLILTGCANIPDSYAPPVQRKPLSPAEPRPFGHFVNMNDPNAEAYFIKDIATVAEGPWRWTGKRPELKFFLETVESLKFSLDYTIAEATFKSTGPVTISVFLNGKLLEKLRHATHGEQHFEKPAPPPLLRRNEVNQVALEVDKVWVSPTDGAQLGFILTRAGFVQ
ncbi:MAG: hypothetical protein HY013_20895 [Candidatus Solibacter usitatus]|nr:hypothetical protein [Candidatus Solibacter usitatus]